MRAVILAGGHVWDEAAVDAASPRSLLRVLGVPAIHWMLTQLRCAGVSEVAICTNRCGSLFRESLGDGAEFGVELRYYEDRSPRGPAGCVRDAFAEWGIDEAVVFEGAVLPFVPLAELIAEFRSSGTSLTLAVQSDASDSPGRERWTPIGVYACDRRGIDLVPPSGFQDLKEAFLPKLYGTGAATALWEAHGTVLRIRDLESVLSANAFLLSELGAPTTGWRAHAGSPACWVHESARVSMTAQIVGPALVGMDVQIGDGALVFGPAVIERGSCIASGAVVLNSVIGECCQVDSGAVVEHSLLMAGARVSAKSRLSSVMIVGDPAASRVGKPAASSFANPSATHAKVAVPPVRAVAVQKRPRSLAASSEARRA